ncbi:MAG: hypothetical protein PHG85_01470 [Candidatus Altiarchaeota archaeon]|nr:hypothetical protein [Candidatus Altiarchaeota archaeon]
MKKRYVGVVHVNGEGDGVIEILSEEKPTPSLQDIEQRTKVAAIGRVPLTGDFS